jgi:ferrous iron transport protein B
MQNVLLIGCPNVGKSSLFNLLTGLERKVSNYSGVTVDSGMGIIPETQIQLIDLPGIYNLIPTSIDEAISVETLFGLNSDVRDYHGIFLVADFSRFESSLALALTLKKYFGSKIKMIVNKSDLIQNYQNIDWEKLEKLLGVEFLKVSALTENQLIKQDVIHFIQKHISFEPIKSFEALIVPEQSQAYFLTKPIDEKLIQVGNVDKIYSDSEKLVHEARDILKVVAEEKDFFKSKSTYKIDKVLLHPLWGTLSFISIFYLIFHALYTWSAPLMGLMEKAVLILGDKVGSNFSDGLLKSLIVDGIFAGVGGVLVFLPQIMILFFLLSLLEQSGYISRAAVLTDRLMAIFGLNGKAFLPFLSGFACSIPAIMSTRTISDRRERMATLLVIPLITCSARLPVYVLLIGTFIPSFSIWGIFQSQALAFFFMYFLGTFMALIMAKIFRLSMFQGKTKSFIIEMPIYVRPRLKPAFRQMYKQGTTFLKKAGTSIFFLSILIWGLSTFPRMNVSPLNSIDPNQIKATQLEHSFIGQMGKVIEPVIKPLGYNWRVGVGLLIAFGARELFVSGLGTIYALGDVSEESMTLRDHLLHDSHFNLAVACSLLIFFAFACQCMSTLAIVKKETQSLKWPLFMFLYMSFLAYFAAFLTYRLLV